MVDISTRFCGIKFENPFVLAAAPSTDELDMLRRGMEAGWSGAVLKTTSVKGTPIELKYPLISSLRGPDNSLLALGNIDLISQYHIDEVASRVENLKQEFPDKVIIVSIMGAAKEEWQSLVRILEEAGVDIIECSYSCPQGTLGAKPGAMLGQDPELVRLVTQWAKEAARAVPIVPKLTPMVTDIVEIARAAQEGGADGICVSNTYPSLMGIDLETLIPIPDVGGKSSYSGLSGSAIKPISLRMVAEVARHTGLEISGVGGAMDWRDAVEFLLLGARNVQFCTAVMCYGFRIVDDLREGLVNFMERKGFDRVADFIGKSLRYITTHGELPRQPEVTAQIDQELCIKCLRCYIACRDGGHMAIEMNRNRLPKVIAEKCVGCGLCLYLCPVNGCITLRSAKEGDNLAQD